MLYNLTDIFNNKVNEETREFELELDAVSIHGEIFEFDELTNVKITVAFIETGKVRIKAEFGCMFTLCCDRCLKPVKTGIDIAYDGIAYSPEYDGECEDGCEFMEDYSLNIDELILSEILMNWPSKVLCKDDCKGICSVCGHDLNEGDCGCDRFVPNPAFAGLSEIFNTDK